jgi:hypothetical protein
MVEQEWVPEWLLPRPTMGGVQLHISQRVLEGGMAGGGGNTRRGGGDCASETIHPALRRSWTGLSFDIKVQDLIFRSCVRDKARVAWLSRALYLRHPVYDRDDVGSQERHMHPMRPSTVTLEELPSQTSYPILERFVTAPHGLVCAVPP